MQGVEQAVACEYGAAPCGTQREDQACWMGESEARVGDEGGGEGVDGSSGSAEAWRSESLPLVCGSID